MASRFGEMLLNRRREMGLSIQQVANTIKMRPQIIEYFETGNFAAMPPRGYAQGMISSYARFLGLNPREVVGAYFDELYVFERTGEFAGSRFAEGASEPASPELFECRAFHDGRYPAPQLEVRAASSAGRVRLRHHVRACSHAGRRKRASRREPAARATRAPRVRTSRPHAVDRPSYGLYRDVDRVLRSAPDALSVPPVLIGGARVDAMGSLGALCVLRGRRAAPAEGRVGPLGAADRAAAPGRL